MRTAKPGKSILLCSVWISTILAWGCESGGVGDPCTPDEEYLPDTSGFAVSEVSVQSRSYECQTRVCLVNKFQGRVSCPYGTNGLDYQPGTTPPTVNHNLPCQVPGAVPGTYTTAAVAPQLTDRPADSAVYCSCRCSGPDPNARYCECPSGFECADVGLTNATLMNVALTGSYCVRAGTNVDVNTLRPDTCSIPPGPEDDACGDPPTVAGTN